MQILPNMPIKVNREFAHKLFKNQEHEANHLYKIKIIVWGNEVIIPVSRLNLIEIIYQYAPEEIILEKRRIGVTCRWIWYVS